MTARAAPLLLAALAALALALAAALAAAAAAQDPAAALAAWVRAHGGRVDRRLAVAGAEAAEGGVRGVVATREIAADTEVVVVPWKLIIGGTGPESRLGEARDVCEIVAEYEKILATGDPWYAPYFRMDASLADENLPLLWNDETREALQGLPPHDCERHLVWFSRACKRRAPPDDARAEMDEAELRAFVSYITRSSDRGLIPVYDLLNHHNCLHNVAVDVRAENVALVTLRTIAPGEQLYNSYGRSWTHEIFRDYGFVEAWPQLWAFGDAESGPDEYAHYFLLFPGGVVDVMPVEKTTRDPLRRSLAEQSAAAEAHTQSLSAAALEAFADAAEAFLAALPTTADQDEALLASAQIETSDMRAAVSYRRTYKRAIEVARDRAREVASGAPPSSRDEL